MDTRTATAYGTVQSVASIRLARTTGTLDQVGPAQSSSGAGATLEAAYIRFAGFTFGAAKDNFSFMPSVFYGAGHWSSFANGAKQIAYTATLGGGISATIAIQDAADTTSGGVNLATAYNTATGLAGSNAYTAGVATFTPYTTAGQTFGAYSTGLAAGGSQAYATNNIPQINGRIDFDQSWGTASVVGALGKAVAVNPSATFNQNKTTYAVGAGLKLNVPQLATGDAVWLNGGYANGMTEYTTNWTSFKSSDTKLNVGGFVTNHPSWVSFFDQNGAGNIQTMKSWNVAGVFQHFWAPQWRQAFMGTYGAIKAPDAAKAVAFGNSGAFGDAKVWNVGTQLAFLPAKDFEIGVEVLYARVAQDIQRLTLASQAAVGTVASTTAFTPTGLTKERVSAGNWTGRLRVERNF